MAEWRSGGVNWCQDVPAVATWHHLAEEYQLSCGDVALWRRGDVAA
jgi:hypothetical protein